MQLIDTHCHLDVSEFAADRTEVLTRARAAGVAAMVVPGVSADAWDFQVAYCRSQPDLYCALGVHPLYLADHQSADLAELERRVGQELPVAIGEIGLDFWAGRADEAAQIRLFEAQLQIAREAGLPVILHVRKAHEPVLDLLRRSGIRQGVAHAFNGSLEQAQRYVDLGFYLGFGGMLTFERSTKLRRLGREIPLSAIVLETDAPDMTVASHRGERNSPEYLPEVGLALAEVRAEDPTVIAEQTTRNACELFGLDVESA